MDPLLRLASQPAPPVMEHLLRDCLALGRPERPRQPAQVRLEKALGRDLARRLVASLTVGSRG